MTGFISVRNWDRFQHYKDRSPPWIKVHASCLDSFDTTRLSDAEFGQLVRLWLLASRHDNRIPADLEWIRGRIGGSGPLGVEKLASLGFIEMSQDASTALGLARSREAETETEAEERRDRARAREEVLEDFNAVRGQLGLRALSGSEHQKAILDALKRGHTRDELRQAASAAAVDEWVLDTHHLNPIHVFRRGNLPKYLDSAQRNGNGMSAADLRMAKRLSELSQESYD